MQQDRHGRTGAPLAALLDAAVEAARAPVEVLGAINVVVPDGLLIPDIGIPHYWRLELEPAPRLYLGTLERGGYTDRLVQAGERTALGKPFPFDIDPAQLVKR